MVTGRSVGIALASLTIAAALLPALAGAAAESSVTIVDDAYDPRAITVTAGDSVSWRWANGNANPHTVTAFDGSFDSDAACPPENPSACRAAGHSFSVEFTEPGTYAYHCRVHPVTMIGTVDVVAASEEPSEDEPTPATPSEAASEREPSEGEPSSPPPSDEEGASSRTTRGSAGPPGFVVESLPSSAPSGGSDDPVAAPPQSVETSPGQPVVAAPTAAPSGSPAAIGRAPIPPRGAAVGVAAALLILSTVALGRFVLFARRW